MKNNNKGNKSIPEFFSTHPSNDNQTKILKIFHLMPKLRRKIWRVTTFKENLIQIIKFNQLTKNYKFMIAERVMKLIRAWAFYDWANSVYPLVISTAIFPLYYSSITKSFSNIDLAEICICRIN